MIKSNRGGKRNGSGRKKVKDKIVPLTIYVRRSAIKNSGGKKKAKELAANAVSAV